MKYLILILAFNNLAFAENNNKERYDEMQQAAGKWSFISNTFFLTSIVGLGTCYYGLDKIGKYSDKEGNPRENLTEKELKKYSEYDLMIKIGSSTAIGGFLFGLGAYGVGVSYERDANAHAIKFKIDFN